MARFGPFPTVFASPVTSASTARWRRAVRFFESASGRLSGLIFVGAPLAAGRSASPGSAWAAPGTAVAASPRLATTVAILATLATPANLRVTCSSEG